MKTIKMQKFRNLVTIKKSKIEGLGMFALVNIPKGTKIYELFNLITLRIITDFD